MADVPADAAHPQTAAFFDLDKTVIAKASMVAFGKPLYRAGLVSRWLLLRALYGQLVYLYLGADEERMATMRESVLRVAKGWDRARVASIVRETLDEVIEPIVFDEALDLIREHRAAGRRVYIVSASPEEIVAPLAHYLGVDEAIATRAEIDDQGRYTGRVDFYSYGPFKAVAMQEVAAARGIDLSESYAYSDSATDIPMLEVVGHPVAVNPDRELARVAAERAWEVRWFSHRVRLRDRVRMPAPGPTAAVGGGLAATVAAGSAAWWWLRRSAEATPTGVVPRVTQTARTFLAATAASATKTRRMRSFFMSGTLPRVRRVASRVPPSLSRATGSPWASRRRAARRGS
jgi:HAD superfamily hydrolase (TIGR01490 family)